MNYRQELKLKLKKIFFISFRSAETSKNRNISWSKYTILCSLYHGTAVKHKLFTKPVLQNTGYRSSF